MAISIEDFEKVEMLAGKIIKAESFPEARKPAYKLTIDFGDAGVKKSSARITENYSREELAGRMVVAVTNFSPRQIGPVLSEVLVLGVDDARGNVVLLQPDREVPPGTRIY